MNGKCIVNYMYINCVNKQWNALKTIHHAIVYCKVAGDVYNTV